MADEITITTGLKVSNGNLVVTLPNRFTKFDQTTARGGGPGTVAIGTSEETISFGDISPGWVRMTNLDDTNYVQVGFATTDYGFRLLADKGTALFYLESGATIYAKANTASCDVLIEALNS